jgi:hypothetical protein
MSAIVQATCPGCKNILRIPADWVNQPIRCKHCGLVMLSKNAQAAAPVARQDGPKKTPLQVSRPPVAAAPAVPFNKPATAQVNKLQPTQQAGEGLAPAATVAVASAAVAASSNGSQFADLDVTAAGDGAAAKTAPRPARTTRGTWWKGLVVALSVIVLAGVILGFAWPHLSKLLPSPNPSGGVKDITIRDKEEGPPKDGAADGHHDSHTDKAADSAKDKTSDATKDKPPPPPKTGELFPRRALVISLHNYLYADAVNPGRATQAHNIGALPTHLNRGLRVPFTQIGVVSDAGPKATSPTKSVIQESLVKFLEASRPQDRLLVFFIGHAVEIGDDVFLVPIEGELENTAGLIPLKWVYKMLADCKAREKVLVLDVGRANPTRGAERPGTGPMGPKLDALVHAPPAGVQLWSACSAGQFSYETDASPMGVFLDKVITVLEADGGVNKVTGKIQRPEDALPIEAINEAITKTMKAELDLVKLIQVPRVTGKEAADGAPFNKDEPFPPDAQKQVAAPAINKENAKIIQGVLDEISLPPIKPAIGSGEDKSVKVEMLPPFDPKAMAKYGPAESPLRKKIQDVRVDLWAYSIAPEPADLKKLVADKRGELKLNLGILKDSFRVPADEKAFQKQIGDVERDIGKILSNLKRLRADFIDSDGTGKLRKDEPSKRWQVNYDYVLAHLEATIAFLYEYQTMLGGMRKELPPKDPGHNAWHMIVTPTPNGDADGKKLAKSSGKTYEAITGEHPNTPWFVLAKRERMISLGLEWKSVK